MRLQVVVVERHQSLLDVTCPQPTSTTSNPNKLAAALPSLQHHRRRQDHTDVSSNEDTMQRPVGRGGSRGPGRTYAPNDCKNRFQDKLTDFLGSDNAKRRSASGGRGAPDQGSASGARWGLCPQTPVIGLRSPCGPQTLDPPVAETTQSGRLSLQIVGTHNS